MQIVRPRRLRSSDAIRDLVRENQISLKDLIAPLFVVEGSKKKEEIQSMPGQFRYTLDYLIEEVKILSELGIKGVAIFPAIGDHLKDSRASESLNPNGLYLSSIREINGETTTVNPSKSRAGS